MKTTARLLVLILLAAAAPLQADMVGEQLPSVTLSYLGKRPDTKGKPMLLEFWATWCPPCRESIPHLNEIHAKFKDRGLAVVGVTDEPQLVIRKFQKEIPMNYAVATDTGGRLGEKLGVSSIPTAFLVDKDGKITWQGHPMSLPEAEIEKILE
jgi:thiol-disulfide isomerase/thioredoxin